MGDSVSPKVAVVVLNWNGLADTLACVASLKRVAWPGLEIIVVDNGSAASPLAALREREGGEAIDVVELPRNLGYAGGNNVGIRRALAGGADFVWVLNNDTVVDPAALSEMVAAAERHPRAGVIGAKVLRADDPSRLWLAWGVVTWRQSLIGLVGEDAVDDGSYDVEREVPWLPGTSLLLRRPALEEVGAFDAEFFAYHEDVDWAARAAACGWTSLYCGRARIWHAIHGSSGGASNYGGFRKYLSARNSILYARRHGRPHQQLAMAFWILATLPFVFLRRAASGETAGVTIKVRGWLDGLRGRPLPLERLGLR
jgi:GT2 family glycosyltransferase